MYYIFYFILFNSFNSKKLVIIKFKIFIILISYIYINLKIYILISPIINDYFLKNKMYYTNNFLILKEKSLNLNDNLINKEKLKIYSLLSRVNITNVDIIFFTSQCSFGNCIICLNKLLFFCEIISCKSIILDQDAFWYIKNTIKIDKYNYSIKVDNKMKYNKSNSLFFNSDDIFYSFFYIKPHIRINLIRNEIINNLNKVIIDKEDLFIHIRSGDIFIYPHRPYAQPPLCFYRKILINNNYKKVYLISQNNNNPVIQKLINEYPNIFYIQNSIKYDISYLINAYNIVASVSSFLISIIQLNYNLSFLWEYNIYKISDKILCLHYDLYEYPNKFIIFRMEPSPLYQNIMSKWKNNKNQRKLMLKEKCINNFFRIIYK